MSRCCPVWPNFELPTIPLSHNNCNKEGNCCAFATLVPTCTTGSPISRDLTRHVRPYHLTSWALHSTLFCSEPIQLYSFTHCTEAHDPLQLYLFRHWCLVPEPIQLNFLHETSHLGEPLYHQGGEEFSPRFETAKSRCLKAPPHAKALVILLSLLTKKDNKEIRRFKKASQNKNKSRE